MVHAAANQHFYTTDFRIFRSVLSWNYIHQELRRLPEVSSSMVFTCQNVIKSLHLLLFKVTCQWHIWGQQEEHTIYITIALCHGDVSLLLLVLHLSATIYSVHTLEIVPLHMPSQIKLGRYTVNPWIMLEILISACLYEMKYIQTTD